MPPKHPQNDSKTTPVSPSVSSSSASSSSSSSSASSPSDLLYEQAIKYLYDQNGGEDKKKGLEFLKAAAQLNHPGALNDLGCLYLNGEQVKRDEKQAFSLFQQGVMYSYSAIYNVGCCYLNGQGVVKDEKEAIKCFKYAAMFGEGQSAHMLAKFYAKGITVEQNARRAKIYYEIFKRTKCYDQLNTIPSEQGELAELQDCINELSLAENAVGMNQAVNSFGLYLQTKQMSHDLMSQGLEYLSSINGVSDAQKGFKLLEMSALDSDSGSYDGIIYDIGCFREGIGKDARTGEKLFDKPTDINHRILYDIGCCFRDGKGVVKDEITAEKLFEKAMDINFGAIMSSLGDSCQNGVGIKKDEKQAFAWYQKAAACGYPAAIYKFACCFAQGKGIEKNEPRAFELYQQAANCNYFVAIYEVARCYELGKGTEKNEKKALELFSY